MSFSRVPWSDEESKRRGCLNDGTERAAGKEFGVTELDNRFVEGNRTGSFVKFVLNADCLLPDGWCHVNRNETVQKMMGYYDLWQATGDLGKPDLLSNRVFGALTRTLHGRDETLFITAVTSLQPCASIEEWRERTTSLLESSGWRMEGEKAARERHQKGWNDFWARSWIEISSNASETAVPSMRLPLNPKLPISYGRDSVDP